MPIAPALRPYLVLQQALDKDVLQSLGNSAARIEATLRRLENKVGVGAAVRRDQLRLAQAEINREAARLWTAVGGHTQAALHLAAAEGAETVFRGAQTVLPSLFSAADRELMIRSARESAAQSLRVAAERVSGTSYIPLADSVYTNLNSTREEINRVVDTALTRGLSARELAAEVRDYVNPATPGGVRYASMRLARTELNNAFHAAQVREARRTPWVNGLQWNLSGSHPKPDECNDYADHGGDGIWDPSEIPGKPHPHCLCYTTPRTVRDEDFVTQYASGAYDSYLEEAGVPTPGVPTAPLVDTPTAAPKLPTSLPKVETTTGEADRFGGAYPRMRPEGYDKGLPARVNPGQGHHSDNFDMNCHYVVNAMELRARGYQVVASPTILKTGRFATTIAADWIDPATGVARQFTRIKPKFGPPATANAEAMIEATADWPNGARGYVRGTWFSGGGHIFNVFKDEFGNVRYMEGQKAGKDAATHLGDMTDMAFLRVDDLEPVVERVLSTSTAGDKPLAIGAKKVKMERLQILIDRLSEDIANDSHPGQVAWNKQRRNKAILALDKLKYP